MSTAERQVEAGLLGAPAAPEVPAVLDAGAEAERPHERRRRGWLLHRLLLGADILGLSLAFAFAEYSFGLRSDWPEGVAFLVTLPVWVVAAKIYGLYDRDEERTDHSTVDDLVGVFHLVTVTSWLLFVAGWISGLIDPSMPKLVLFWVLSIAFIVTLRAVARSLARQTDAYRQNALIVGAGIVGQEVAKRLLQHPEYGIDVVGFADDQPRERDPHLGQLTVLGSPLDIRRLIDDYDVERVILAFSNDSHEAWLALMRTLKDHDVQVDVVPRLFEMVGSRAHLHSVEGITLLGLPPLRLARSWQFLKRSMDLVLATVGIVVLSPVFVAIAVAIRTTSRGPVLFRQVRMGKGGQPFEIIKFRTMVKDAEQRKAEVAHLNMHVADDPRMFKIPDDPRMTRVGQFLRRFALDELPQLFNVIRGEMSLVGPRPLILEEDSHIADWGRRRLDLKPGVTGPWQALGASSIPFEEMVRLDYLYITNWSLYDDVKWLWRTIPSLARPHDAY